MSVVRCLASIQLPRCELARVPCDGGNVKGNWYGMTVSGPSRALLCYQIAPFSSSIMYAISNRPLISMHSLYLPGIVLAISLGLFAYWFGGKRALSVFGPIKAIFHSEFSDYAALSGVPLPRPLKDFDLYKAKPRPYRPFRWNYVQNMGMSSAATSPCK